MNIYVGNLSFEATEKELEETFGAFGEVQSVSVIRDKYTGRSRGFGFVEMPTDTEAQAAIEELHDNDFQGRNLVANEARPRTERRDRGRDRDRDSD